MYVEKLNDVVHECNNKYHRTFKMKPDDVKPCTYNYFGIGNNEEDT